MAILSKSILESFALFQAIVSGTQDAIVMIDDQARVHFWNSAAQIMFGYSEAEAKGKDVRQLVIISDENYLGKDPLSFFFSIGQSPLPGKPIKIHLKNKSDETFIVELTVSSVKFDEKWYGVSIIRDITLQEKMEHGLKVSEEKYRLIAENTSDGIVVLNSNNAITYVSPGYTKLFGYSEAVELGRGKDEISSIIHPEDRDKIVSDIFKAIANKVETLIYVYRMKHQNGQYIWREDSANFKYNDSGEYVGAYIVCRDVTDRKRSDEKLQEKMAEIQKLNSFMIGRELKMVELKNEISSLQQKQS